jgi:penicillin amidase
VSVAARCSGPVRPAGQSALRLATSAPGQSGQPGSPHYADLLPLWQKGEYFPMTYSRARVEQVTRHRLKLKPAG